MQDHAATLTVLNDTHATCLSPWRGVAGCCAVGVGVLVNNAGLSYDYPEYLHDVDDARVTQLVELNCLSLTKLTKAVLPAMREKKTGAIVNVSSISGIAPTGLLAVYSASKAYVDFFSRSIAEEYARDGIFVQSLMPMFVSSPMSSAGEYRAYHSTRPAPNLPAIQIYLGAIESGRWTCNTRMGPPTH